MSTATTGVSARAEDAFTRARAGLQQLNASPWESEVVEALARHGQEEGSILRRYEELVTDSESPAVRYLVSLILEEERRHHRIMGQLAESIAWSPAPRPGSDLIPGLSRGGDTDGLRQVTKELLAAERADRRELRALLRRMKDVKGTTLWALVLEILVADTDKHIRILSFLRRTAR